MGYFEIVWDPANKKVTINKLSGTIDFNDFESITAILSFTLGPVSTLTQLTLSDNFEQDFLSDPGETFSDEILVCMVISTTLRPPYFLKIIRQ